MKNYVRDGLNRAYKQTVQRCEAIKAGTNDDLDIKSFLHNLSNAYAQPTQAVLTGKEAIARGMYHGVAQLVDSTYWKNRALGMVEAVKFIGSVMAEDAWLESWETEYHTAALTGNADACDQLLEQFKNHEFQPLNSVEQGIRQTCIQLQTLSWDQLVEHGAQLATSLALDCVILKAGEFALSPTGRAFIHDITETLKLPPPRAQEYMVELAGIGKIALEEGVEVATALAESSAGVLEQSGNTLNHILKKGALLKTAASTPQAGNTPQAPLAPPVGLGAIHGGRESIAKTTQKYREHIFSKDHVKKNIMDLVDPCLENGVMHAERTKDKILAVFEEIIHAIDTKGLLKDGTNNIQTAINNINTTIQIHIKNGVLISIDGYIGFSNRVWTNAIKW